MYSRMLSDQGTNHTLLIELSTPSVKNVVYIKVDLRLMKVALNPKF